MRRSQIAERPGVIFTTFGDAMRVPGTKRSLLQAKAAGCDIRMVYSPLDALELARRNPDREVVFFGLGFETTTPSTALTILQAAREGLTNFSLFCNHITVPEPIRALLSDPDMRLDGFIGPGHVSMVIGTHPYDFIAADFGKPIVVAGFEPVDLLQSVLMVLRQIAEGRAEVENQYARVVPEHGNPVSLAAIAEVYERRPSFEWRGLGEIDASGLRIRPKYAAFDAEEKFGIGYGAGPRSVAEPDGCACGAVMTGRIKPTACPQFGRGCTPETPLGRADGVLRRRLCRLLAIWWRTGGGGMRPLRDTHVTLSHGGGGTAMRALIENVFTAVFQPPGMEDQARLMTAALQEPGARLAFTTDSFVVTPLEFPGGDIGTLAVCGTVNDLAVGGARPLWLSAAFIIEEGCEVALLRRIVASMAREAAGGGRDHRDGRHQGCRARLGGQALRDNLRHRRDPPGSQPRRRPNSPRRCGDCEWRAGRSWRGHPCGAWRHGAVH